MQQPTSTPMVAPVVEVTLFEDRAQALRRASLEVAAGTHRLELDAVSPILSDRSLRAELVGSSTQHARLLDFRVRREVVTSDKQLPGDLPELVAERRRRTEALRAMQKHREAQSAELEQLGEITTQLLREAAEDTGWGRSEPERWRTELADLRTRQAALQAEILALVHGYEDAERELEDLGRRIRASKGWDARLRCWIEVDLEVDRPTALILELAYVVPGACWRPRYRATLSTKPTPALALEMQTETGRRRRRTSSFSRPGCRR